MAASFTTYPTTKTGSYEPILYEVSIVVLGNDKPPALEIDVLINSASFRTLYVGTFKSVTQVGADYVYIFEVDVSETVQAYFNNNLFFFDSDKTYPYTSIDLTASTVLDAYEWQPDINGVLTRNNSATRSNSRLFFNSLQFDMTDYTAATGRKFMTTNTDYRLSSQVTNLLSVFADTDNDVIRILGDTTTDINLTRDQINIINLNDYFTASTSSLRAYIGTIDGVDFVQTGELLTYTIISDICEPIGLHYQNELGTAEVFRFRDYEYDIQREIQRDQFVSSDNLVRQSTATIEKTIEVRRNGFFLNEWNNFKQVATSSVFYVEETAGTLEEVYANFRRTPFRSAEGEIDIALDFTYSVEQKIFSN